MPRIPDRWLEYSPTGSQISDTPFIALKCPLHDHCFNDDIPPVERFVVNDVKTLIPSLSMIIDLTFTYKYYDHEAFDKLGVVYNKIPCIGHEIPSFDVLRRFFRLVDDFLQNKQEGDVGLIGVHCTHGVNRTGFIICSYMISKLGYTYENAVKEFNQARGHNIERQNYLTRLQLYETKPLFFIHNENDTDPRQELDNGRRTKERVKPRHRRRKRFDNVHSEQRESTSKMDYSYRKTNNEYFPNRYHPQFNPSVPRRMPHPNSMPHQQSNPSVPRRMPHPNSMPSYNNYRGHDSRRKYFNGNDFRPSNTHVIPPHQIVFHNRFKFVGPRSPNQFSLHHPPAESSHQKRPT